MSKEKKLEDCNDVSQMEVRKWEDLSLDCLVNIFGRLGLESLALDVQFVCKSWYIASKSPICWKILDFSKVSFYEDPKPTYLRSGLWITIKGLGKAELRIRRRISGKAEVPAKKPISVTSLFVSCFILRSAGLATKIVFPMRCNIESLILATKISPALKTLELPNSVFKRKGGGKLMKVKDLIREWKNVESLTLNGSWKMTKFMWKRLNGCWKMTEIIPQIGIHCKNLDSLTIKGTCINNHDVMAIVTHLPNVKLSLKGCYIDITELVMLLKGCKLISCLDVKTTNLDNRKYEEIEELASCTQSGEICIIEEFSPFGKVYARIVTGVDYAL